MKRSVRLPVLLVVALTLVVPVESLASEACEVYVQFRNHYRRVPGPVNAECGFTPHNLDHGYGNWGVSSNYGRVRDTYQFSGWKRSGRQYHWQSCTREHPPPTCEHYNDNGCTTQRAVPDVMRSYGSYFFRGWRNSCAGLFRGGVYTTRNVHMTIYELDWPDSDDWVATLRYGTINVPITCNGQWDCTGSSAWKPPGSGHWQ